MRILKQAKLRFTEGKSDKVYEVDLILSAEDEYVVNFRYGRFGNRLREGTKTIFPVDLKAAELIYEKLVAEKTKKGYANQSGIVTSVESSVEEAVTLDDDTQDPDSLGSPEQQRAILNRLTQWLPIVSKTEWPLARVIWRAGQLRIKDALPLIARQISTDLDKLEQYAVAWAIANIAEESDRSAAILDKLEPLAKSPAVSRMIRDARMLCMKEPDRQKFITEQSDSLSQETRDSLESEEFSDYLKSEQFYKNEQSVVDIEILYLMGLKDSEIREALVDFAASVEIAEGSFRLMRLLYKLSEARFDGQMYGALVSRLEYEKCKLVTTWTIVGSSYKELKKGVFSRATKKYFKARSVRNFTALGTDGNIGGYITMATGVLASATENTPINPAQRYSSYEYDGSSYNHVFKHAPRYGNIYCLTWLMRGESTRLTVSQSLNWQYSGTESSEGDVVGLREEPFPEFWDQAPDAIIHLLKYAKLEEVHVFANAVWQANPSFVSEANAEDIVAFIRSSFSGTKRLGLELVEAIWDAGKPDFELLEALILCDLEEASELGFKLLTEVIDLSLMHPAFLAAIFLSGEKNIHERLRGLFLGKSVPNIFSELARLLPAKEAVEVSAELAIESLKLLKLENSATVVCESELTRLLASEDEQSMWFALYCYGEYARAGKPVPEQVVVEAIESDSSIIREQGMLLLESFSDAQLVDQADLIASCCTSKSRELRKGILVVLERLVKAQQSFGQDMVMSLYSAVLRKETSEGIHDDVLAILLGPLGSSLKVIPDDSFRRMLKSKYSAAHVLGFYLLEEETELQNEALLQLVEWVNHPHFKLREAILGHLDENPERLLIQLSETRPLVESEWTEVREFGMEFLRNRVPEERWTVEALVDLCDSVKPSVQDFGREMITKRFREEDGEVYMMKLSQHPTREMQQFATHFLKQTASDQPEIILNLEFYFRTVMGAVSAGRVAKDRVLGFLKIEAKKDERVAALALNLWNDYVVTCAIGDKAAYLEAIFMVQKDWPNQVAKLKVLAVEKREVRV